MLTKAPAAPGEPYCLREDDKDAAKIVGHKPSWATDKHKQHWSLSPPSRTWLKVLLFPLWGPLCLYRRFIYDARHVGSDQQGSSSSTCTPTAARFSHCCCRVCRPDVVACKTRPQDWNTLQSEMRYLQGVFFYLGPPSHVLYHIKLPLAVDMAIAILITINVCFEYYWLPPFLPDLDVVILNSFRLITFLLALLLSFRVNRTYDRWWQARQGFAGVGGAAVAMSQQAVQWVRDPAIREEIYRWCKVWHYSILQLCRGDKLLAPKAAGLLTASEREVYHSSRKGRQLVILQLRRLIAMAELGSEEFAAMEGSLQAGVSAAGTCARLKFQSMPYSMTLMCTGFLQIWLLFLPCAIISVPTNKAPAGDNPLFGLVIYFFTAILMLGVDEVANQLEQPFPHLPLQEIAETTLRDIDRMQKEFASVSQLQDEAIARQRARLSRQQQEALHSVASPHQEQPVHSEQQRQQPRDDTVISVV